MSISKSELVANVAASTNLPKSDVDSVIAATLDAITETLAKKDTVSILGFGTFSARHRPERTGRNPRTGEDVTIKETWVPTFKPGKTLKEKVAG